MSATRRGNEPNDKATPQAGKTIGIVMVGRTLGPTAFNVAVLRGVSHF